MSANYASRTHKTSEKYKENKKGNTDWYFFPFGLEGDFSVKVKLLSELH